jgi:alkylation response protein AidB-like acyl-CoA dehydrogenase
VDVDLTEEQEFFAETTRRFLWDRCPTTAVRALETNPDGFDRAFWKAGCELGWTSMLVSETDGGGCLSGPGRGILDVAIIAEEMGRVVAPGPLVPTNVVAYALSHGGTADQKQRWLPGLLHGDVIGAWVNGSGSVVEAGAQADVFVQNLGDRLRVVAADDPAVEVTPWEGLDLVRRFASVVIADEDAGEPLVGAAEPLMRIAVVLQCAETCGVLDSVFDMTLEYLGHRYSFGRPLSSYQALKHRIADDKMQLEACHAVTTAAAHAIAEGAADAGEITSAAKAWVGSVATDIVQDCVQHHGGIAVTWEHDIHLFLRRATVNRAMYGTAAGHRQRLANVILGAAS